MKKLLSVAFLLTLLQTTTFGQLPQSDLVYMLTVSQPQAPPAIYTYNPDLPISATNPKLNTIALPGFSHGLAVTPVLGSGNPILTFYTVSIQTGTYWYYDPVSLIWVNTNHAASILADRNIGAGGGFIYNFNPNNGNFYKYDGTGNATPLTLNPGIANGNIAYDIVVDCVGNFYLFSLEGTGNNSHSFLRKYNPSGNMIQAWTVYNPNNFLTNLGGIAIIGTRFFINGDVVGGSSNILEGNIGATTVTINQSLTPAIVTGDIDDYGSSFNSLAAIAIDIATPNTTFCEGTAVSFTSNVTNGGANPQYEWYVNGIFVTGATDPAFTYNPKDGDIVTCKLTVAAEDCVMGGNISSSAIVMTQNNAAAPSLNYDPSVFCKGSGIETPLVTPSGGTFSATPSGLAMDNNTGIIDLNASNAGTYVITYAAPDDGDCPVKTIADTITIWNMPAADINIIGDADNLCLSGTVTLETTYEQGNTYKWSSANYFPYGDDSNKATAKINANGIVYLTVTNAAGCEYKDEIQVKAKPCCDVFVPNAFSPNGDGDNDVFTIYATAEQRINQFSVFNKYGEKVFSSNVQSKGWDGSYKEGLSNVGTYFYYLNYLCSDGTIIVKKGDLTLIR